MKGAVIFACAIAVVFGYDTEDIELNDVGCPVNKGYEKLYPHADCNKFYQCSNGELIELECSINLWFDAAKLQCDWSYKVDCGSRNVTDTKPEPKTSTEKASDEDLNNGTCNCDPAEAPEICAQSDSDGVLIAGEYCNHFYKCSNQVPVDFRCPENLLYNPYKEFCDWFENVDCGNKTISEYEESTKSSEEDVTEKIEPVDNYPVDAEAICAQEGSNGTLVAHEYCNWFYNCVENQPVAQKCPGDLLFNPVQEFCDWPERVTCVNKTTSDSEESTKSSEENVTEIIEPVDNYPVDAENICAQEDSNGVLVAHEYCNWFYNCLNNQPVAQKCPGNLLFNPDREICDWPERVTCVNKTISNSEENSKSSEEVDDNSNSDEDDENNSPINDNPAEAAAICAQEDSDGTLVAHENCDEFYICNSYVPVAVRCVEGLLYNPAKKQCGWPENVDCGDRKIPTRNDTVNDSEESCNCDPSEAPEICARAGSDGVLIAHENCNQYYKCYAGEPNALSCSGNLLYDAPKGWCDWPQNVDCGDRVAPDNSDNGNDNPADASEICARAGSDGTLVPHELCNKFFKCSNREAVEFECEFNLRFNIFLGLCDWSFNVVCGDRQ